MKFGLLSLAAGLLIGHTATASDLWATTSGSGPSIQIYQIDSATGAVIQMKTVATGLAVAGIDDLASDPVREPSVLWAVRWSAFLNQMIAIDPYQGKVLETVPIISSSPIHSLAIDPTTGISYGTGGTSLYRIARDTGIATLVGNGSIDLDKSIGFDSVGNLFGIGTDGANYALAAIDKTTGGTINVKTLNNVRIEDFAARPEDGVMLGLGFPSPDYALLQINLENGTLATVGPSLSRPSSLAFTSVPEPSALAFCVLTFVLSACRRHNQRRTRC
jgi:hypothetical protein